ncbi:MAG: transcriptional repressor [Clostridiales bacterium]|nr:transcriptional repressor [Clostridiales bacterium]
MAVVSLDAKKDYIIQELKKNGCRITVQRRLLLDIILSDECSCCKEIYYHASKEEPTIGMATVYRMVKMLEETGLIQRKNMYRIDCERAAGARMEGSFASF